MIGRTISHYQILDKLGDGGMAVVYKALDVQLGRKVALKFLRGHTSLEGAEQLLREAQTASALDHPNICTVYEIAETAAGQRFIAMAYYEGRTLAERLREGPLDLGEALDIAIRCAHGLHRAHQHGIIHLDVKPHNVMLLADSELRPDQGRPGQVKILDFGIAHLGGRPHGNPSSGGIYGTIAYMAPERFSEDYEPNPRCDVWSLGLVLYEMVSGANPFERDNPRETFEAIRELPLPPLVRFEDPEGANLNALLAKALARDADQRYADMGALLHDLEALARLVMSKALTQPIPPELGSQARAVSEEELRPKAADAGGEVDDTPSIAVLPFADKSPEGDQEHLCFGIAEELIHLFTSLRPLKVASFISTRLLVEKGAPLAEIRRQLHVHTALEGSVQKAGERLRVRVSLLRLDDGLCLWSEKYDREFKDFFEIQDEIAKAIVVALEIPLLGTRPDSQPAGQNLEAYNLFLKGRYYWNKRAEEETDKGIEFFRQAIAHDAEYARAWAGLADSYTMQGIYSWKKPESVMPRAREAAERALASDATLADVYASRGSVRAVYDWDFAGAEQDFERAIELDPCYATAYQWYAMNVLLPLGRFADARERLFTARELDPLSLPINVSLGIYLYYRRAYEEAVGEFEKAVEVDGGFVPAHVFLSYTYTALERHDEALRELREAELLAGERPDILAGLGHHLAATGAGDEVKTIITRLYRLGKKRYVSPLHRAQIFAALRRRRVAFEALRAAVEIRAADLVWLGLNPFFESLHDEPEFREILAAIGLDAFPAETCHLRRNS